MNGSHKVQASQRASRERKLMHPLIAQTTYYAFGKSVTEGAFYFTLTLGVLALLAFRVLVDRLDRSRIRSHVCASGGQVLDITWSPFGRGWFGEKSDRVYEVTYRTKTGKTITASCKTSMFTGVYWASDMAPDSFPSDDSDSGITQCLSCGATIPGSKARCPKCGWSYNDTSPNDRNAQPPS